MPRINRTHVALVTIAATLWLVFPATVVSGRRGSEQLFKLPLSWEYTGRKEPSKSKRPASGAGLAPKRRHKGAKSQSTVIASGEIWPRSYFKLISDVTGRIQEIQVTPGDEIKKGQPLAIIEQLSDDRRQTTLYSPLNGVVADIATSVGENVSAASSGPTLMTLADMSKIYVKIYVDEKEIARVRVGQRAQIIVDAFSDQIIRGLVKAKSSEARAFERGGLSRRVNELEMEFEVTVEIQGVPPKIRKSLRPGMSATATITTNRMRAVKK